MLLIFCNGAYVRDTRARYAIVTREAGPGSIFVVIRVLFHSRKNISHRNNVFSRHVCVLRFIKAHLLRAAFHLLPAHTAHAAAFHSGT